MDNILIEMKEELTNKILNYWVKLIDKENGGCYGFVDYELNLNKEADKGGILNSRILWFGSATYCLNRDEKALKLANHAFEFLKDKLIDKEYKGIYWMVNYKGEPCDTRKHTYNQAFAIYGLAQYYKATGNKEALELAIELYNLLEEKCKDEYGYLEEFTIDWKQKDNEMLSENGIMTEKTMNTHLHVMEAYTVLYEVWKNEGLRDQLKYLLDIAHNKIYDKEGKFLKVFFDRQWNSLIDLKSFGHDIEATWLIDRAADVLGDADIIAESYGYTSEIAEKIYNVAYESNSLLNESEDGSIDTTRIWWVQAETVIGFYNAYEKTKDLKYKAASEKVWGYIKEHIIDKRENSEWYSAVDKNGEAIIGKPIVEPWKCPYHNGRMCIEIIGRIDKNV